MKKYLEIAENIMKNGELVGNRTGIRTKMVVGRDFRHDMREGFPLLTTKKINPNTPFIELEGFLNGVTDKKWYQERKCFIWDEWCNPQSLKKYDSDPYNAFTQLKVNQEVNPSISPKFMESFSKMVKEQDYVENLQQVDWEPDADSIRKLIQLYETDLGQIYGYQWRSFGKQYSIEKHDDLHYQYDGFEGVDQVSQLINTMKQNPLDRRMIVSAWNPIAVNNNTMALPPCHWAFNIQSNGQDFDMLVNFRSWDFFLGAPFNIAFYGMLMKLLEKETGLVARELIIQGANVHFYENQFDQVAIQLAREPRALPTLKIPDDKWNGIFNWKYNEYELTGYDPHPFIKAPVAV